MKPRTLILTLLALCVASVIVRAAVSYYQARVSAAHHARALAVRNLISDKLEAYKEEFGTIGPPY